PNAIGPNFAGRPESVSLVESPEYRSGDRLERNELSRVRARPTAHNAKSRSAGDDHAVTILHRYGERRSQSDAIGVCPLSTCHTCAAPPRQSSTTGGPLA